MKEALYAELNRKAKTVKNLEVEAKNLRNDRTLTTSRMDGLQCKMFATLK